MAKLTHLLLLFLFLSGVFCRPVLRFNDDNTFKIIQFTDLHYGSGGVKGIEDDFKNYEEEKKLLEWENPDLVVYSGDILCNGEPEIEEDVEWKLAMHAPNTRKIPWAVAFGNHDDGMGKGKLSRQQLVEMDQKYGYSLTQSGPHDIHGVTNYFLRVLAPTENDTETIIWLLDSNDVGCMNITSGWGCVEPDQVKWYQNESKTLSQELGHPYPALAFQHIPPMEYDSMYFHCGTRGLRGDSTGCPLANSGLIDAFVEQEDVKGLFVGHCHKNDFWGYYKGIRLHHGRKTGWGYYNGPDWFLHGARVIEVQRNPFSYRTWLRLVDGSVVEENEQPGHMPSKTFNKEFCGKYP